MEAGKRGNTSRLNAERLRKLWASLSDAMARRLDVENVNRNPRNQRMVTSVLLLMAARSAAKLGVTDEEFARIAKLALGVCGTTTGARRASRAWVAGGGIG